MGDKMATPGAINLKEKLRPLGNMPGSTHESIVSGQGLGSDLTNIIERIGKIGRGIRNIT